MSNPYVIKPLLLSIRWYQRFLSPMLGMRCRYYPTCSCYAIDALYWYEVRGLWLAIKRILRCHPFGGSGVDFVPIPLSQLYFVPADCNARPPFRSRCCYGWFLGKRFGKKVGQS